METNQSTQGSRSRALDVQPTSERRTATAEPFPSDRRSNSTLTATTAAPALGSKTLEPTPGLAELSSDNLGAACAQSHQESFDFEPVHVSYTAWDPNTTTDLSSRSGPVPGCSSSPAPASSSGPGSGSDLGSRSGRGQGSVPGSASGPGHHSGSVSCPASGTGPGSGSAPEVFPSTPQRFGNLRSDLLPWCPHCHSELQKKPTWKFLQVSEPGARGIWKSQEAQGTCKFHHRPSLRGQCLLHNWEEERATNHLDQVSEQDGSESFFFRHGHQGLLTRLQSSMPSTTTQKDSYQPPRNFCQPLRGKREAMLEMLLYHQICKEVQAEEEPPRKLFEVKSVTHHDYQMELTQAGPPAPTKPHDYRQEQPETFWKQRAPQLPGVSYIRTLDAPFRKNCSFSTPVPLSLGQPLPYEPDSYPHQMGEISSLACQGSGQGFW